jgi:hypothetical protein
MWKRTDVIPLKNFLDGSYQKQKSITTFQIVVPLVVIGTSLLPEIAHATNEGAVSKVFDAKIWPLLLDLGKPLAKSMMAIGIYKCIRNDVDKGWKTFYRAGLGLAGLYLIDGAINIIDNVGTDLRNS